MVGCRFCLMSPLIVCFCRSFLWSSCYRWQLIDGISQCSRNCFCLSEIDCPCWLLIVDLWSEALDAPVWSFSGFLLWCWSETFTSAIVRLVWSGSLCCLDWQFAEAILSVFEVNSFVLTDSFFVDWLMAVLAWRVWLSQRDCCQSCSASLRLG